MYLIQLLLPVSAAPDAEAFASTREELADKFGGVTAYSRAPAEGIWRSPAGDESRDSVLMVEVLVQTFDRPWWRAYRDRLARRFRQEEIHVRAIPAEFP
jgi:hypothetical protein